MAESNDIKVDIVELTPDELAAEKEKSFNEGYAKLLEEMRAAGKLPDESRVRVSALQEARQLLDAGSAPFTSRQSLVEKESYSFELRELADYILNVPCSSVPVAENSIVIVIDRSVDPADVAHLVAESVKAENARVD